MITIAKLPRAGLTNKLLVWADGVIYAKLNSSNFIVTPWYHFSIGPFIRNERSKRLYFGYFKKPSFLEGIVALFFALIFNFIKKYDFLRKIMGNKIFSTVPIYSDFTAHIREHRWIVKEEFFKMLNSAVQKRLQNKPKIQIGVHIRLGDFKLMNISTPLEYYKKAILKLRESFGSDLAVTIFSDGTDDELHEILCLKGVERATNKQDIDDLVQLSKSEYLVLSQDSSFGYFAAFVSDATVICKPSNKNGIVTNEIEEWIIV